MSFAVLHVKVLTNWIFYTTPTGFATVFVENLVFCANYNKCGVNKFPISRAVSKRDAWS